jgi:hypothetical protein
MDETYREILIEIFARDEDRSIYPVRATLDDGSHFSDGALHPDLLEELMVLSLDLEEYGLHLFRALFAGPMREVYELVIGRAEEAGRPVRFRLWIDDDAPELHALHWERMYHLRKGHPVPLLTSTLTPFSRYVKSPFPSPPPVTERPIRILFAVASPAELDNFGLMPLDLEEEVAALYEALGDLQQRGLVQVRLLAGRTGLSPQTRSLLQEGGVQIVEGATSLTNLLRQGRDCHVFHLMCHGATARGTAALLLEDSDGKVNIVRDRVLVSRLATVEPLPHLMFLASGDRARDPGDNPHLRLGWQLVRLGIPAVVLMQDEVSIEGARQLTNDFYRRLLEHGLVDQALNEARFLLFEPQHSEWAIPVLFTRLPGGRLFDTPPARAPDVQPQAAAFAETWDAMQATLQASEATRAAVAELAQQFKEVAEGLREMEKLAGLSDHLRTLQSEFSLCVTSVERAGRDVTKIQVDDLLIPAWNLVRRNRLYLLELFVRENPHLGTQPWSQPLLEQAEQIDKDLSQVALGSLAKGIKTFETQLVQAESYVHQQLVQAISNLVHFADQTLGGLAVE